MAAHLILLRGSRITLRGSISTSGSNNRLSNHIRFHIQNRRFGDVPFTIKTAPDQFQLGVIATGVLITGGSLYFLAENLLFGTAGGIVAKTCTAPLERLTTHRQAAIDKRFSIANVASDIYREEGVAGFWRGNGINVFRASIQKGSLFALNDFFKSILSRTTRSSHLNLDSSLISFICGAGAGITSTLITYPMDPVKTVNQATIHQLRWPAMSIWYSLSQSRGYLMGPWTGGLPTVIGTSVYYGVKFAAFDKVLGRINTLNEDYELGIPSDIKHGIAGAMSGICGNCITYPNNCVRKRIQTAHVLNAIGMESSYTCENYWKTVQRLVSEGGVSRLYRGFFINLCRNAPNTAIQFVVYKRLQRMWNDSRQ